MVPIHTKAVSYVLLDFGIEHKYFQHLHFLDELTEPEGSKRAFADGPQILIDAGVRAIVQPGGSMRDEETIAAAEAAGVTMYTTGTRHFAH